MSDKNRRISDKAASGPLTPRGAIVLLAAFNAIYLGAGAAVDLGKAYAAESALLSAAESTATALALKLSRVSARDMQIEAEKRLAGDLAAFGDPSADVTVTVVGGTVRVSATARFQTVFLRMFQKTRLPVNATFTASAPKPRPQLA